jgi:hypothetical protein
MTEMETYHNNLLVEEQQWLAKQAELDKQIDELKPWIAELLEENHPAELERLTGIDDVICKKVVNRLYMEGFNDRKCWEPERVGDIWVIFGKNFSGEWIDENGDYLGFDTKREAMDYIKETFK